LWNGHAGIQIETEEFDYYSIGVWGVGAQHIPTQTNGYFGLVGNGGIDFQHNRRMRLTSQFRANLGLALET